MDNSRNNNLILHVCIKKNLILPPLFVGMHKALHGSGSSNYHTLKISIYQVTTKDRREYFFTVKIQ